MAKKKAKVVTRKSDGRLRGASDSLLSDGLKAAQMKIAKGGSAFEATHQVAEFRKNLLFTGMLQVDLNLRLAHGSRIELIGEPHAGKTLLTYKLLGAIQRTCRQCMTPIIPFINDFTGELVSQCMCGANDPSRVVYFDQEDEFDPSWAKTWGFDLGDIDYSDRKLSGLQEVSEGLRITPDARVAIVKVTSTEAARDAVETLFQMGAVDAVAIDSLAMLNPQKRDEGVYQPGAKAKALSELLDRIVSAQLRQHIKEGISPTFIYTNQYRMKIGLANPRANPNIAAGGTAWRYGIKQGITVRSKYNDSLPDGWKVAHTVSDITLTSKKDKITGGTNAVAQVRAFLKPYSVNRIEYVPGETDEGTRLYEICKQLGEEGFPMTGYAPNPAWFRKDNKGYHILGRSFKTAKELKIFLSRQDVGYMLRLPISALFFESESLRSHLMPERYLYTPFKDDPIFEVLNEATNRVGTSVVEFGGRGHEPTMLPKGAGTIPEAEETGSVVGNPFEPDEEQTAG
jgi:RecA/RadA recombinase